MSIFRTLRQTGWKMKMFDQELDSTVDAWEAIDNSPEGWCLVDAQSVADDLNEGEPGAIASPDPAIPITPPFPAMWLEWRFNSNERWNAAVVMRNGNDRDIGIHLLQKDRRDVLFYAVIRMELNEHDGWGSWGVMAVDGLPDGLCESALVLVANALARMHCQNVTLRPRGLQRIGATDQARPYCGNVWHEIIVSQTKVVTDGQRDADGEPRILRHHRVRGHYADYRKGSGLFGRIKGLFWIPDHKRGDESIGRVIAKYTIH